MREERPKPGNSYSIILLALAALTVMPFGMIASAVLEGKLFGTTYLADIALYVGVYEPLKALHDALVPILGW